MLKFEEFRDNPMICAMIHKGNDNLGTLGYTDHSMAHAMKVATVAGDILEVLGYNDHDITLVKIAGLMHDMGNCINRTDHAHYGALMSMDILMHMGVDPQDIATIAAAIGNHDEQTGTAVDAISAALILADKSDVRRNRVRNRDRSTFDIHDRVNYATKDAKVIVNPEQREIHLALTLDDEICSIMDYFEIFLQRMLMCKRAAEFLECKFKLTANGSKVL